MYTVTQGAEYHGTEWSGYMTAEAQGKGSIGKATQYVFSPLIDGEVANPDTVVTIFILVQDIMQKHGQTYVYLIADMQIDKICSAHKMV